MDRRDWSISGHGADVRIVGTTRECADDLELTEAEVVELIEDNNLERWGFNARHEQVWSVDDLRELLGRPKLWKTGRRKKRKARANVA